MRSATTATLLILAATTSARYLDVLADNLCSSPTVTSTATITTKLLDKSIVTSTYTVTITPAPKVESVLSSVTTTCLSDAEAKSVVDSFKTILSDPDRKVANATAQELIADEFLETSDSVNSLVGFPLGGTTFASKEAFIDTIVNEAGISRLTTLDIFHDCSRIVWYWAAGGIGTDVEVVRGVTLLYTTADKKQVVMAMAEFNSLAWAKNVGWTVSRPAGGASY